MSAAKAKALADAIYRLMKPLINILIRNGFPFSAFVDICKRAYVDVARDEFKLPGKKPSASRISLLTGLPRKDVAHVLEQNDQSFIAEWEAQNRTARIVLGWAHDPDFVDQNGKPVDLCLESPDDQISFSKLVKRYSGDIPVRATLDELTRIGCIEWIDGGKAVRLKSANYLPETGEEEKLWILGIAGADLYGTINHNLTSPENGFVQRYQYYDNIPLEALPIIRTKARGQSVAFMEQIDQWLSAFDRDNNPTVGGTGRYRAGVGVYYFENPIETTTIKKEE